MVVLLLEVGPGLGPGPALYNSLIQVRLNWTEVSGFDIFGFGFRYGGLTEDLVGLFIFLYTNCWSAQLQLSCYHS